MEMRMQVDTASIRGHFSNARDAYKHLAFMPSFKIENFISGLDQRLNSEMCKNTFFSRTIIEFPSHVKQILV